MTGPPSCRGGDGADDQAEDGQLDDADLEELIGPWWVEAHRIGAVGGASVSAAQVHLERARAFAAMCDEPVSFVDLGTGAGSPGLFLALLWPASVGLLVDSSEKRAALVERWVGRWGLARRMEVYAGRAEDLGAEPAQRERFAVGVARSFAKPPVVAELAAPLVSIGGEVLVSEPPDGESRWDPAGLAVVGLADGGAVRGIRRLRKTASCPERFPRRGTTIAKRPLW